MRLNHFFHGALATTVAISSVVMAPTSTLAHGGHGDEFNSTGEVLPVHVNEELDGQLGVEVTAIAKAGPADSVLVPTNAVMAGEGDSGEGAPFVFVKADEMYRPVAVTLGEEVDGAIAITGDVAVGDEIVTGGNLVLFAESRKAYDAHELDHAAAEGSSSQVKRLAKGLIVFAFGALVGGGAVIVATRNPDKEDGAIDETPQNA